MSAGNKTNLSLVISVLTIIGLLGAGYTFLDNKSQSNNEVKTNANKVPKLESDIVEIKLDVREMKTDLKNNITENRVMRDQMIVTNKLFLEELEKLNKK